MKEAKEKERETLRNEQNNPFSRANSVIVKRPKTQNTKKGWRPTAPKHTWRVFSLLSLWSLHGHLSSYLFIAKVSLILFFSVLFFFGGCVSFLLTFLSLLRSLFLILLFIFPAFSLCVTKKPDQITEYLKCSFWCSVLVPASSHFHLAQLRTPTRTREPPLKMVFVSFLWLLTMCWNTYFYSVSWTSTKISPNQNGP